MLFLKASRCNSSNIKFIQIHQTFGVKSQRGQLPPLPPRWRSPWALDVLELYGHQTQAVHERDKKPTLHKKLEKLLPRSPERSAIPYTIPSKPRVTVNIGNVEIEESAISLLSKGPQFAVLGNSKSGLKRKLEEADVAFERYAYAKRWAPHIELSIISNDKTTQDLDLRNPEKHKSQPLPLYTSHNWKQTTWHKSSDPSGV